ncbi:Crp/Fnr family transcriptional regulator [Virgibacillus sp. AGTR]|uniref:Crp/Fnr family transcriptional regulator n=1 Tax=Virgibacillus sp. AGTR TaxID=2812055 RepID=UPI00196524DC|nr:Crp/Fnr family transcriptional regulator [Virgibacillus sp. AGTR]MCC2249501.1 Crp/Fnr family transcriptional regulator [Virgibacillus sp. AGTR]QRZ17866.1 Crp/Fnr family transcriptional regulator [Virgibacillus sp. AGTR]
MTTLMNYIQTFQLPFPDHLEPYIELISFQAGQQVVNTGDKASGFYILTEGKYRVTTNEVTGKSLLLRFCSPVSILGDIEYFQKKTIQSDVITIHPATFIYIPYTIYERYLRTYSPFTEMLLEELSYKLQTCTVASRINALAPVEARFAAYLCTIYSDAKFGKQLFTTNTNEVASLIGTTPRHLNRVLKRLSEQHVLIRNKEKLHIKNWPVLLQLSEGIRYE